MKTLKKERRDLAPFKTFFPQRARGIKDILHFKPLVTEIPPSDGAPPPELSVGGLALALSGADHLQGGLEAVPQVPVRYQVIAVLSNIAQSSCESPEVLYI